MTELNSTFPAMTGSFRIINLSIFFWIIIQLSGCDLIPADPEKTLENAAVNGLKAGYTPNYPWVYERDGEISGIEAEIINGFAQENGLMITWVKDSEQELMKKLGRQEINIVAGGILKNSPWKSHKAGFSRPYFKEGKEKRVIVLMQGENRLLFRLEKYLEEHKSEIRLKVSQAGKKQ